MYKSLLLSINFKKIQDLIDPLADNLKIRECPEKGVFVEGLTWLEVGNTVECMKILLTSEENRKYGSTKSNTHSSRSHTVLMIKVEKRFNYSEEELKCKFIII